MDNNLFEDAAIDYKEFGWIRPDGSLISSLDPKVKNYVKNGRGYLYPGSIIHGDLLYEFDPNFKDVKRKDFMIYEKARKLGYLRYYVNRERGDFGKPIDWLSIEGAKINFEKLLTVIKNIKSEFNFLYVNNMRSHKTGSGNDVIELKGKDKANVMLKFKQFIKQIPKKNLSESVEKDFPNLPSTIEVESLEEFLSKELHETIEEDSELLGIKQTIPDENEVIEYFKRIVSGEKTPKDKYIMPYVHKKVLVQVQGPSIVINKDQTGAAEVTNNSANPFDLDKLKQQLKVRPKKLLSQNEKMSKSISEDAVFFNFGLPALRGLVLNEKTDKFVVVNTCPGAGSCKLVCYALKGGYVQYPAVFIKQTSMLNYLLNDPQGFFSQLEAEISLAEKKYKKQGKTLVIRWHDAGDFFSDDYRDMFIEIVKKFPDVIFYAYTKIANVANADVPDNFVLNFSQGALPGEQKNVDVKTSKNSVIVPKELFQDHMIRTKKKDAETGEEVSSLEYKSANDIKKLKDKLANKYDIDVDTILTYKEMMSTPRSNEKGKYNVIVVPGEGDVSASRKDVLGTYLLIH